MAAGKSKKTNQKDQNQQGQKTDNETSVADELGTAASQGSKSIQEAAGGISTNLRQQITGQVTVQQDRAVDTLEHVALLLHQAGEHARKEDKVGISDYADRAAEQLERFSKMIGDREPDQLLSETKELAQRQPALFVGGALVAGFLGARFLRSSEKNVESNGHQDSDDNKDSGDTGGSQGYQQSAESDAHGTGVDYGNMSASMESAILDIPGGSGAVTGSTDTASLEGTLLEEDAAILMELEEEERIRREQEGLGGTSADNSLDDLLDPEKQ